MPRLLPLAFLAGLLVPSTVAADPADQDINQWLTHRHAALTKVLDSTLSAHAPQVGTGKTVSAVVQPGPIRVSMQPMPRLSHTPNI